MPSADDYREQLSYVQQLKQAVGAMGKEYKRQNSIYDEIVENTKHVSELMISQGATLEDINSLMATQKGAIQALKDEAEKAQNVFDGWSTSISSAAAKIPIFGKTISEQLEEPLKEASRLGGEALARSLAEGAGPVKAMGSGIGGWVTGIRGATGAVKVFGVTLSAATLGIAAIIAAIIAAVAMLWKLFSGFNKDVRQFAGDLGVSANHAKDLAIQTREVGAGLKRWGVDQEAVVASQVALSKAFKDVNMQSNDVVRSTALLAEKTELSADEAASMMRAYSVGGKDAGKAADALATKAGKAGVPFKAIAEDLGKNVDLMYEFGVENLEAAAIKAREFGLELKDITGLANNFLDPMEAVNKANELNLLFGTQLNGLELQRLANMGKTDQIAQMLNDQLDAQGKKFSDLSLQEKQSLAALTGMSNDKLAALMEEDKVKSELAKKDKQTAEEGLVLQDSTSIITQATGVMKGIFVDLATKIFPAMFSVLEGIRRAFVSVINAAAGTWLGRRMGIKEIPMEQGGAAAGGLEPIIESPTLRNQDLTRPVGATTADQRAAAAGAGTPGGDKTAVNVKMFVDGQEFGNALGNVALGT